MCIPWLPSWTQGIQVPRPLLGNLTITRHNFELEKSITGGFRYLDIGNSDSSDSVYSDSSDSSDRLRLGIFSDSGTPLEDQLTDEKGVPINGGASRALSVDDEDYVHPKEVIVVF